MIPVPLPVYLATLFPVTVLSPVTAPVVPALFAFSWPHRTVDVPLDDWMDLYPFTVTLLPR